MKVLVIILCLVAILPMWFMAMGSLQNIQQLFFMPPRLIPLHPILDNYLWYLKRPILRWATNSAIVVAATVTMQLCTAMMCGYAFAMYDFKGKRFFWLMLLVGVSIPAITTVIPRFIILRQMMLTGTLWAVILPSVFAPPQLYLTRRFFESVPTSILDSARIDGAGEMRILFRIVGPLCKPIIATLGLFSAVGVLGDFMWQLLQLQKENVMTLLIGIIRESIAAPGRPNPIGREMAGGFILLVPLLVIFAVASKHFTHALSGAVKE